MNAIRCTLTLIDRRGQWPRQTWTFPSKIAARRWRRQLEASGDYDPRAKRYKWAIRSRKR